MIGGAARLAAVRASTRVIQQGEMWSSDAFMVYMRANMEDPRWVRTSWWESEGARDSHDKELGGDKELGSL